MPIKSVYLRHCGYHEIVDNITGEDEGVDEPAILLSKSLGSDCWLGRVGTWEGEVYCKDPERVDNLGGEAGRDWSSVAAYGAIANSERNIGNIIQIWAERDRVHPYYGGEVEGGH